MPKVDPKFGLHSLAFSSGYHERKNDFVLSTLDHIISILPKAPESNLTEWVVENLGSQSDPGKLLLTLVKEFAKTERRKWKEESKAQENRFLYNSIKVQSLEIPLFKEIFQQMGSLRKVPYENLLFSQSWVQQDEFEK